MAVRRFAATVLAGGLTLAAAAVPAQTGPANIGGIYRCVDARGRTITSDRPIAACLDREQQELNPSGTTRRIIEPSYTAQELADMEERRRQAAQAAARQREEARRERALLIRYPDEEAHERERARELEQIDIGIAVMRKRIVDLAEQRRKLEQELEFYKKDISRAPPTLRRQLEDNLRSATAQERYVLDQEAEKRRVNARFAEERARLTALWPRTRLAR